MLFYIKNVVEVLHNSIKDFCLKIVGDSPQLIFYRIKNGVEVSPRWFHHFLPKFGMEVTMYNVGDKIVYPMHGAGIIESIEDKEILGKSCRYYVMKIPVGDLKVMIPTNNVDDIGIRNIISISEADKVFKILSNEQYDLSSNWNKRYKDNMIKIKSGNIFEVADVVGGLMHRDRDKGLSTGERKMLSSAKQILISELVLAKGLNQHEIEDKIQEYIYAE